MKITYDIHKGGNTKYATITKTDRAMVLKRLERCFYRMLEDAAHDKDKRDMLYIPHDDYRTNSSGQTNNLQSFTAGILAQHSVADRDFSIWQIEGIELASRVFNEYYSTGEIEFVKGDPHMPTPATLVDEFFE